MIIILHKTLQKQERKTAVYKNQQPAIHEDFMLFLIAIKFPKPIHFFFFPFFAFFPFVFLALSFLAGGLKALRISACLTCRST